MMMTFPPFLFQLFWAKFIFTELVPYTTIVLFK